MRLEASAPARAIPITSAIVAWNVRRWLALSNEPLMTVVSPHRHVAESEARSIFGGTTKDYDFGPIRAAELPRDIGWRYVRAAPSELVRGDVAHVGGTVVTVSHSLRHEGGHLVIGLDIEGDAVCFYGAWDERTPRVSRGREKGVTLIGARVKVRRDGGERWGVVADVGSGHAFIVVRAAEDAGRLDVAIPNQEGWLGVSGSFQDIKAAREHGRKAVRSWS